MQSHDFSERMSRTATSMNSSMLPILPSSQEAVEQAAMLVDQAILADRSYLDLSDLLQVPKHNQATVSGLLDFDYPSLSDPKIGLGALTELGAIRKVPLPAELVEQFGHMQCNCMMGLFPEISRAWLSIDSDIFIWNYEDGSDLAYFDGLSETILSAGLVKPKPGIFQPSISYLLCLATAVDIVLLGVSFNKPFETPITETSFGEMHLLPEPLFSIPTDNDHILKIVGADNGRIFLAGKDGCLYELIYQAEDGWFSRKCRKVNHSQSKLSFIVPSFLNFSLMDDDPMAQISIDNSRNILYTRSEKGTIQVFDFGADGKSMGRVAAISQQTTMQNAALVAKTLDRSNFKPVVHVSAVTREESSNIHLVAITHTGVRLYFTTNPFGDDLGRPSMLSLVHVRLPPGFSASAPPQRPNNVHAAYYNKGNLMLCASQSEDNDMLWTITSDSFPFQRQLRETHEYTPIDGRTWAIAEIPSRLPRLEAEDPVARGGLLRADPPVVVTQHMQPDRRFILINSQGSYLLSKQQPVDQLKQLLVDTGPDSDDVKAFFQLHREQACATCLILACSPQIVDDQVTKMATRAFFLYGGEPEYNFNAAAGSAMGAFNTSVGPSTSMIQGHGSPRLGGSMFGTPAPGLQPNQMSTPYPNIYPQLQQFQTPATSGMNTSMPPQTSEVFYSGRHTGLCLYLARILRPLWDSRMVRDTPVMTAQGQMDYLESRLKGVELSWILAKLTALKDFFAKNSMFPSTPMSETFALSHSTSHRVGATRRDALDEQTRRKYQAEAETQENVSLKQLQQLTVQACESLGLWRILCDHQFHVIADSLTKDQQNAIRTMTFRSLINTGKEIGSVLITSLINLYLGDHATTDSISERLRTICPSLYSSEDAVYSKGYEELQSAKTIQNPLERERLLEDSLKLFKQITGTSQLDLNSVCNQFGSVHYYRGIVDLVLTAASRRDPQGYALHFYKNGEPQEDSMGLHHYSLRMDCYNCITGTLDYLLSASMSHPQAPSVPVSPGPPPALDANRLTNTEAERYAEEMFTLALKSDDEMFHVALYDWLISKNLSEKLLETHTPYLEPYLMLSATSHPDNLPRLDLLWKYYEKNKDYAAASRILAKLADRQGAELTLQQRLEYLSRATMCAKSSTLRTSSAAEGEFLHELEEKMEVARLQLQIYETLSKWHMQTANVKEALCKLNSELIEITELYASFADTFDLSEAKLAIFHCAGHNDPPIIESLWQDIIEKELQQSAGCDAETKMKTLHNKLITLGRTYGGTEKYFPLAFLVKHLEKKSCELNFDRTDLTFVQRTIQEVGVTLPRLHEIYDRLFKSKDPWWKSIRKPYHVLYVIHKLLDRFCTAPNIVPAYERRHYATTCLDAVANYLVELQAQSAINEDVRTLTAYYKDLQAKLERLN